MTGRFQPAGLVREWWILVLVATAATLLVTYGHGTRLLDIMAYDLLVRLDDRTPDPDILLVAIDDDSLATIGPWPWPRQVQAGLIRAIEQGQPRAIAYDVQLIEPSAQDQDVAAAMAGSAPIFLPLAISAPGRNGARYDLLQPPAVIRKAAAGIGHVSFASDEDGVVRRVRLWEGEEAAPIPHLMTLMHAALEGQAPAAATAVDLAPRYFPLAGPAGSYRSIGAGAVLRGELPEELLRNHIILVGATAQGLGDWHPTALRRGGGTMAGIEIQANVLDALQNGQMISDGGFVARAVMALIPLWLLLIALRFAAPREALLALAILILAILSASVAALIWQHVWLPPALGIVMLLSAYPIWGWRRLSVLNIVMIDALDRLHREPDLLPPLMEKMPPFDPVTQQAVLLRNTITAFRKTQRQREDFVQFLSHDIRSPQASIIAALAVAKPDDISLDLSARITGYARRTLELADDFVHLARAEMQSYAMHPVDLSAILHDALDELWPQISARKITVDIIGGDDLFIVAGDRALLTRAVINILRNAIKYGPEGGKIRCRFTALVVAGRPSVRLAICDEGPGIAAERKSLLFRKFARGGAQTSKYLEDGVGIGLAFVHTVITRHQGEIFYEDGSLGGACFVVQLGLCADPADEEAEISQ